MKSRLLLASPLIAAVALLSACGGSDDAADQAATSESQTEAPQMGTAGYLQTLKNSDISFSSDTAAIEAGKKVCQEMKAGKSLITAAGDMKGVDDTGKATIAAGAAVATFCPDQISKIGPSR